MKLMIIIVNDASSENVVQELVKNHYRVTRMSSTGGFLRRGNSTLLVGMEDDQVQPVLDLLKGACCQGEPAQNAENQSRATAFVVNMAHQFKI